MGMRKLLLILFFIPSFVSAQTPLHKLLIKKASSGVTCGDTDGQTYINALIAAGASVDQALADDICDFVTDFKAAGHWTGGAKPATFFHLHIGSTEDAHSLNLLNPIDDDAAYRLTFNGSWTFDNLGSTPTAGAYALSHLFADDMPQNTGTMIYATNSTGVSELASDMGHGGGGSTSALTTKYSNVFYAQYNSSSYAAAANTASEGIYAVVRINSTNILSYKDGSNVSGNGGDVSVAPTHLDITIGCNNDGTFTCASTKRITFSGIFEDGLSAAEIAALNTLLVTLNTGLGR